jgi:hypothetical protein
MVQPSEHWHRDNLVRIRAGHARCWNRDTLTKALMRAARVDISESEFSENAVQVPLPQEHDEAVARHVLRGVAGLEAAQIGVLPARRG